MLMGHILPWRPERIYSSENHEERKRMLQCSLKISVMMATIAITRMTTAAVTSVLSIFHNIEKVAINKKKYRRVPGTIDLFSVQSKFCCTAKQSIE